MIFIEIIVPLLCNFNEEYENQIPSGTTQTSSWAVLPAH